jgi:hypothetical protein
MRFRCFLFLVGLALIFGPGGRPASPRAQPGKACERAAPAGRPTALEERWNELTGNATVWRRADDADPLHRLAFDLVAERVQSTNGEITREQFLAMSQPAGGPKPDERRPPAPNRAAAVAPPPAPDEGGPVPGAQAEFRRRDRNGDGRLDLDEMDEGLRAERDRWDANGDGFIDLAEFKNYLRARRVRERETARVGTGWPTRPPRAPPAADLHPKLPPWFREYDSDGDGQVSLYEWRAAGQPIAKFLALDDNGDGFLTPDEVLPPDEVAAEKKGKAEPQPDPGSLTAFQNQVGQVFAFTVTGAANGAVWGSDVYTADSTLAVAAVHAGVLAVGKTGMVRVRIVAPPPSFTGSTANGVTTRPYGSFPGAYQIVK